MIECTVYGEQKPMGSKRAFVNKKTGRAIVTDQGGAPLKSWQHDIRVAMLQVKPETLILGAVKVTVGFYCPRPKHHYGMKGGAPYLKNHAPDHVITKPDLDKTARAVLDCGTGILYKDDSQVSELIVTKVYSLDAPRTWIRVEAL